MPSAAFFNYTVPDGLVSVIRGFRYELTPLFINPPTPNPILVGNATGKLTLGGPATGTATGPLGGVVTSNGADILGYENFQLGQYLADYQPCYVIVAPLQTISLIITFTGALDAAISLDPVGNNVRFNAEFYGNNLLATGRPVNYEPGFSDPLPVYDRSEYQQQRERELVGVNARDFTRHVAMPGSAVARPPAREQYTGPRPRTSLGPSRGLWSRPGQRRR